MKGFGHQSLANTEAQTRQKDDEARRACTLTRCTVST